MKSKLKTKKDTTARYLWHLSSSRLLGADEVVMTPKARGVNRGEDEPKIARVCVSIYPSGGFTAIPLYKGRKYYLYRSKEKITSHYSVRVLDAVATGERWLLEDQPFIKVASFSPAEFKHYLDVVNSRSIILGHNGTRNVRQIRDAKRAVYRLLNRKFGITSRNG